MFWSSKPKERKNNLDCNLWEPRITKPATDLTKWFLTNVAGRQTWEYVHEPKRKQTLLERYSVGLNTDDLAPTLPVPTSAAEAARNAVLFYSKLQAEDGHWANDNSGTMITIILLGISAHITGTQWLKEEQRVEMIRYLRSIQCPNGGWPIYFSGPPTVFGCCLIYVLMRLLGVSANDPDLIKAKQRMHEFGGPLSLPTWAKLMMAMMNLYSYEGMHTPLPELWLLPDWLPMHPSKMWTYSRMTHLAMSYIYSHKISTPTSPLVLQLRQELYTEPYELIRWSDHRNNVSWADRKIPKNATLTTATYLMDIYEYYHFASLRKKALDLICEHIRYDDEQTHYINISSMGKSLHMVVCWHKEGPESKRFKLHQERIVDYLWMGRDGLKVHALNGSQMWDTTLTIQALLEGGADKMKECEPVLAKALNFIKLSQFAENNPDYQKFYKHPRKGGFSYSTLDGDWLSVDVSAEALKSMLKLKKSCAFLEQNVCKYKIQDIIDMLLTLQNPDGGFASFELVRGMGFMETLNASEMFHNAMSDFTSIGVTSSVLTALALFLKQDEDGYRRDEIRETLERGMSYVRNTQRPDGPWYGLWGLCFTYGTFYALEALACMGDTYESGCPSDTVKKACDWLVTHRLLDGGWGEKFESYDSGEFVPDEKSQLVQTAWAVLGLMAVRYPGTSVIEKGIEIIASNQLPNGDFRQGNVMGVYLRTCGMHYDAYKNIYPMKALGRFAQLYPQHILQLSQKAQITKTPEN